MYIFLGNQAPTVIPQCAVVFWIPPNRICGRNGYELHFFNTNTNKSLSRMTSLVLFWRTAEIIQLGPEQTTLIQVYPG